MSALIIRPLQPGEAELFLSYPFPRQPELWETARDYSALLAHGEYRPEHTWVTIRDGIVVARACWWAGPEDERPAALDWLEAEPGPQQVDLGTSLLLAAHERMRNDEGAREKLMPRDPAGEADTLQWTVAALNSVEMVSVPWRFLGGSKEPDNGLADWLGKRLGHVEAVLRGREWIAAGRFTVPRHHDGRRAAPNAGRRRAGLSEHPSIR